MPDRCLGSRRGRRFGEGGIHKSADYVRISLPINRLRESPEGKLFTSKLRTMPVRGQCWEKLPEIVFLSCCGSGLPSVGEE